MSTGRRIFLVAGFALLLVSIGLAWRLLGLAAADQVASVLGLILAVALAMPLFERMAKDRKPSAATPADQLVSRAIETIMSRHPGCTVRPLPGGHGAGLAFLFVTSTTRAGRLDIVEETLIGVCEYTATETELDRVLAVKRRDYPAAGIAAILLYGGEPASAHLRRTAAVEGVHLMSFIEYKIGFDLRPFAAAQHRDLDHDHDPRYQTRFYVPQRYQEIDTAPQGESGPAREDLLGQLLGWLDDLNGPFVVVLAPFGYGKSFLLSEAARRMHARDDGVVPVLVQLRDLTRTRPVEELLTQQINRYAEPRITVGAARNLLLYGRIALLADGFDELVTRVGYIDAADHLQALAEVAQGRAKIVVTARDEYFLTDRRGMTGLGERLNAIPDRRVARLADFDESQIHTFLAQRLGSDQAAGRRLALLREVEDLRALAANPRMLDFIADISETRLRAAGGASGAALYREVLHQWLDGEHRRLARAGPAPPTPEQLWEEVGDLAERVWTSPDRALGPDELTGANSLLVRGLDGRYRFVHQSVLEWIVAERACRQLADGDLMPTALRNETPRLLLGFVRGLAGAEPARRWAERVLRDRAATAGAVMNAVEMLKGLGLRAADSAQFAGKQLPGEDLSGQQWRGADAARANLAEANLTGSDLTDANLTGTDLVRARLDRTILRGAILRHADLTGARLLGADLTGADLTSARARRAAFAGAAVTPAQLDGLDMHGAAGPADLPQPQFRPSAAARSTAIVVADDLLAEGSSDGTVRLWDAEAGQLLRVIAAHTATVHSVAFLAGGRRLVSGGGDGRVRLWNTATGEPDGELEAGSGPVHAVAVAPDGTTIAAAERHGMIWAWNAATGARLLAVPSGSGAVWSVALSRTGHLAAGCTDGAVRLWHADGTLAHVLPCSTGPVWAVAFSPDGGTIVGGGVGGALRRWHTADGAEQPAMRTSGPAIWSAIFADNGDLATGADDGKVTLWPSGRELAGHNGPVMSLAFGPHGRWLLSDDGTLRKWHVDEGRLLRHLTGGNTPVRALRFAGDGLLATGDDLGVIRLWTLPCARQIQYMQGHTGSIRALALSSDGQWLAIAGGKVTVVDTTTSQLVGEYSDYVGPVRAVAFAPDGGRLVSGSSQVRVTDLATGRTTDLGGHTGSVRALAWSADGVHIASSGDDQAVRIWDAVTGEHRRDLDHRGGSVRAVAFTPDGRLLATGGDHIRLWDLATGDLAAEAPGHGSSVNALAHSADGRWLASVGADAVVRLWDARTAAPVAALDGHSGWSSAVTFLADEDWLATAGDDGTIRIWNIRRRRCEATLISLTGRGWAAIATDHTYKVEGVTTGEFWLVAGLCRFEPGEIDPYLPVVNRVDIETTLLAGWPQAASRRSTSS
ncbi:NACHT and WD40 repeat domain-containing protein [Actinoplanes solisilvae]|uniref:NACHT and WD40 repeat domain-containing protein n=1 Tax=Actinoplanes solisilvae TaxID=2486853 RepID=UPI000FD81276|nr:pentapeptide repeat-containing protein [Actinoplanes solisilvae]